MCGDYCILNYKRSWKKWSRLIKDTSWYFQERLRISQNFRLQGRKCEVDTSWKWSDTSWKWSDASWEWSDASWEWSDFSWKWSDISLQHQQWAVPLLCISLLIRYFIFRFKCRHQGAKTYITKTYSNQIILQCLRISKALIILKI
jgi:hypothetical protein